jgi:hypothetical protein
VHKFYLNFFNFESFFNSNFLETNDRLSNLINLRNTARNSLVTYGAIQKVFKTRFDENRSNARLEDFSSSSSKQSFLNSKRLNY